METGEKTSSTIRGGPLLQSHRMISHENDGEPADPLNSKLVPYHQDLSPGIPPPARILEIELFAGCVASGMSTAISPPDQFQSRLLLWK